MYVYTSRCIQTITDFNLSFIGFVNKYQTNQPGAMISATFSDILTFVDNLKISPMTILIYLYSFLCKLLKVRCE